jgi:ABC-type transport system substrate-binding protein
MEPSTRTDRPQSPPVRAANRCWCGRRQHSLAPGRVPASTRGVADICANGSPAPPDRGASSDSNRTRPMNLYVEIGRPNFDAISQLVQQQWKAVGVPINLMPLDRQVMQDLVYVKRDFDVNLNELNSSGDPEIGIARLYICSTIGPTPLTNGAAYCNPDVDKLFAAGAGPSDPKQRGPSYQQVVKLLADDMPTLPLIDRQDHSVANTAFN